MSNLINLVASAKKSYRMSDLLRDFKKHTSKKILKAIRELPESRRNWLLDKFAFEAKRTG